MVDSQKNNTDFETVKKKNRFDLKHKKHDYVTLKHDSFTF